jgi:diacylglycerol kinase (ATP)
MKHVFIFNSLAGNGDFKNIIEYIESKKNTLDCDLLVTKTKDEVYAALKKYKKNNIELRIYSIGGDGTLNGILNGIKKIGNNASIAVLPLGTGNDFSHMIYTKNKFDIKNLIEDLINGINRKTDIGIVNGRYFLNISSVGFDSDVVLNSVKLKNKIFFPSKLSYLGGIFLTLFNKKNYNFEIDIDGILFSGEYLFIVIANGKFYGGGITPSPQASISDGLFDICMAENLSIPKIIKLLPLYKIGKHIHLKEVTMKTCKKISIKSSTEFGLNIDGDIVSSKKAEFSIIPNGIDIVFLKNNLSNG